jgi:hypothetical protein
MLLRYVSLAALGLAVLVAGCSDQITRPQDARAPEVALSYTTPQLVDWLHDIVPPSDTRGDALTLLNAIKNASDKQAAGEALFDFLGDAFNDGLLGTTTIEELLLFLQAVAGTYGLTFNSPDVGELDELNTNLEHVIAIVTASSFGDMGADDQLCIPTNENNAAMCLKRASLRLPAVITVFENRKEGYIFPGMPGGFHQVGKVFDFEDYNSIIPKLEGGKGVVAAICVPSHAPGRIHKLFKDADGIALEKEDNAASDHECPSPQASLFKGDNLLARGMNAATGFLFSTLAPRPVYASHSLAHRGFALSPWAIGESDDNYTVRVVRTVPSPHTDTTMSFKTNGNFVFWVEVKHNGVVQPCGPRTVEATAMTTDRTSNVSGAVTPSVGGCSLEGTPATPAWKFELSNILPGTAHKGQINVGVDGVTATTTLTYVTTK